MKMMYMGQQIMESNYTGIMRYWGWPTYFEYFEDGVIVFDVYVNSPESVKVIKNKYPQHMDKVVAFILAAKDGE